MIAAIFSSWPGGPDRRIEQRAFEGREKRRVPRGPDDEPGQAYQRGGPEPPPWDFAAWLRQWVAPPTLIALVAFGGMTAVAHYRLERVEVEVAEIRAALVRDVAQLRAEREQYYARRGELLPELAAINRRLEAIENTLERTLPRNAGPGGQR